MAKTKTTKSVRPTLADDSAPAAPRKTRAGGPVLVTKTPAELAELVGSDTPIGVSRKSLIKARAAQIEASISADL